MGISYMSKHMLPIHVFSEITSQPGILSPSISLTRSPTLSPHTYTGLSFYHFRCPLLLYSTLCCLFFSSPTAVYSTAAPASANLGSQTFAMCGDRHREVEEEQIAQ